MIGAVLRSLAGLPERRAIALDESSRLGSLASMQPSVAGVTVTADSALRNMAVLACIRIIGQSLASVPLILYRRDGRQRTRATDHAVYPVLAQMGNAEMTAYEVRETRIAHCMAWGNAFAEIQYDSNYAVRGLWPLAPDRVGVERNAAGKLQYSYWSDTMGQGFVLPWYRVLHLRYTMIRGALGISPVRQAMNALGVAQATEEYGGRYFANGSRPSIILKHPGRLQKDAYERLRDSFANNWQGLDNAHRINILEEGITPEIVGIPPEEAQFLGTRQYQVQEIARLYGVPLHMLAVGETATYASAEQDAINFRQHTLLGWAERDEQRLMADLLTAEERRQGYYIEYLLDGLERATIETRTAAMATMIQNGMLTPNEGRERENLDPHPGGDVLLMPLNMQMIGADGAVVGVTSQASGGTEDDDQDNDQEDARAAARNWLDVLLADVERRLMARIANDVRQAGAKAMRNGGRRGLGEWGETMIHEWRTAGEAMLAPLARDAERGGLVGSPATVYAAVDIGDWVATAYQAAVKELIGGQGGTKTDHD
jgi:HK97 family phage portal protein